MSRWGTPPGSSAGPCWERGACACDRFSPRPRGRVPRPLEPGAGARAAHDFVRSLSPTVMDDRTLAPDIERVAEAIRTGELVAAVEAEGRVRVSVREADAVVEVLRRSEPIRAPRGQGLNARSWQTEAPLRMLLNNLDRRGGGEAWRS